MQSSNRFLWAPSIFTSLCLRSAQMMTVVETASTKGWALDRVHNSTRRPCGAVLFSGDTAQRDAAARLSRRDFLHFLTLWLDLWPFDLILVSGRGIVIDYPYAEFDDFSFSRFGFMVRTARLTDRQNHKHRRIIAILTRLPSAWVTSVVRVVAVNSYVKNVTFSLSTKMLAELTKKAEILRYAVLSDVSELSSRCI